MAVLLRKGLASDPNNAMLHAKTGYLHLDQYDFEAAAASFETALRLSPSMDRARVCLARCYNMLGRPKSALDVLGEFAGALYERAQALADIDLVDAAELEFRATLDGDPHHRHACRRLCQILRKTQRTSELLDTCEALAAQGVCHSQLLYNWGWALASCGHYDQARRILFDPDRVTQLLLPVPVGFKDLAEFNAALADEILTNPHRLGNFAADEEANRGSKRVEHLFAGSRPDLVQLLLRSLQQLVTDYTPVPLDGFDPWPRFKPAAAHLKAWGLLQRCGDYEELHIHRGGWLSGVYYVRVPRSVTGEGDGPGCIEFGPPSGLARELPGFLQSCRWVPREGMLLLAPSHYSHRTIPTGVDEDRISFAFDVVRDT